MTGYITTRREYGDTMNTGHGITGSCAGASGVRDAAGCSGKGAAMRKLVEVFSCPVVTFAVYLQLLAAHSIGDRFFYLCRSLRGRLHIGGQQ